MEPTAPPSLGETLPPSLAELVGISRHALKISLFLTHINICSVSGCLVWLEPMNVKKIGLNFVELYMTQSKVSGHN